MSEKVSPLRQPTAPASAAALVREVAGLIIAALNLDVAPADIDPDAPLYGEGLGLAASLVSGKVSLLPSTHTPEVIRQLTAFAPDVICLTDQADCDIDLPRVPFPGGAALTANPAPVPAIDTAQLAACVFTSGSTGTPLPYRKTWGRLIACVREEAKRLGLSAGTSCAIVATVPPQHMYG